MADSLRQFLLADPLGDLHHKLVDQDVKERLGGYLDNTSSRLTKALHPFVEDTPTRYWDKNCLDDALSILEADPNRTARAIGERRSLINRAIRNLFRTSPTDGYEESYQHVTSRDLVRISSIFVPDYLRWAEHIYGNLISLYWSIERSGGVDASFDLKTATDHFSREGPESLLSGFDDKIRNAIAHGNVRFTGTDIEFGENYPRGCSSSEFLREYDELCRTANACGLALFVFWINADEQWRSDVDAPLAIIGQTASGGVNRPGLDLTGIIQSSIPGVGRQLHIALTLAERSQTQVLGQCARVATHLLEAGASDFDRYIIEVDHGETVSSTVVVRPQLLSELLEGDAPAERLPEAFEQPPLLWHDESRWATRLRGWKVIVLSAARWAKRKAISNWRDEGIWPGKGRCRIREIENLSVAGIPRVRVRAVLRDPEDADDDELVRHIVWELVKKGRRRLVSSRPSDFESGISLPRRPKHVIVDLFREDGTLRWLKGGGWMAGNIVAVAERTWGDREPVQVKEPEDSFKNIGIRYRINREQARTALKRARRLIDRIREKRGLSELDWEDLGH